MNKVISYETTIKSAREKWKHAEQSRFGAWMDIGLARCIKANTDQLCTRDAITAVKADLADLELPQAESEWYKAHHAIVTLSVATRTMFSNRGLPFRYISYFMPKKKALIGALLMGLFFGILASPCATPVLAVILTFAVTQKEIAYSGGLLLAYALGHWVLVLGAGISAGFAQRVLESKGISNFSSYSKKAAGVILIGVGIFLFAYLL